MDFTLRGSSERAAQPPPWGEQLLIPIFPSSTLPYWWLPWETHFKNIQICSDTFTHDFLVAWKHLFWGSCSTDPTLVTEYNSFCNTVLSISFILLLLNHYSWVLQIDTSAALENKEKSNQALHHNLLCWTTALPITCLKTWRGSQPELLELSAQSTQSID